MQHLWSILRFNRCWLNKPKYSLKNRGSLLASIAPVEPFYSFFLNVPLWRAPCGSLSLHPFGTYIFKYTVSIECLKMPIWLWFLAQHCRRWSYRMLWDVDMWPLSLRAELQKPRRSSLAERLRRITGATHTLLLGSMIYPHSIVILN